MKLRWNDFVNVWTRCQISHKNQIDFKQISDGVVKIIKVLSRTFSIEGNGEHPTSLHTELKKRSAIRTFIIYVVKTKCCVRHRRELLTTQKSISNLAVFNLKSAWNQNPKNPPHKTQSVYTFTDNSNKTLPLQNYKIYAYIVRPRGNIYE